MTIKVKHSRPRILLWSLKANKQMEAIIYALPLRENFIWEQGFKGRALNSEVCRQKLNRPLTCAEGLSGTWRQPGILHLPWAGRDLRWRQRWRWTRLQDHCPPVERSTNFKWVYDTNKKENVLFFKLFSFFWVITGCFSLLQIISCLLIKMSLKKTTIRTEH